MLEVLHLLRCFPGNVAGETGPCLHTLDPHQHPHRYSHIHVPHLSNQILGCVHSAVTLDMNYKSLHIHTFPLYQLDLPT